MNYASILSVNVALTNWRPMHELGITAARWFEGFGFSGNIRRPMKVGGYQAPLDPDLPTMFTMYVPFTYPGIPVRQQGQLSRLELLNTPYVEYERQIREQMLRLFGMAGFDPANDIAGIVLNRWGHAYVVGEPGFHFSTPTRTAPPDVIRRGHGRHPIRSFGAQRPPALAGSRDRGPPGCPRGDGMVVTKPGDRVLIGPAARG